MRPGQSVTMADVATEADVSYGLVYRYYTSKEALLDALGTHVVRMVSGAMHQAAELPGTPRQRLDALLSAVLAVRRDQPDIARALHRVMTDEEIPARLRQLALGQERTFRALLRRLIVDAQRAGEASAGDPDQLATAMMALLDGLSRLAAREPREFMRHGPDAKILLRLLKT